MRRQGGYALVITMTMMVSMISIITIMYTRADFQRSWDNRADVAGRHLQEYVFATQKYLSELGQNTPAGTYSGVGWLKGPSCSGPATDDYLLNCAMQDANALQVSYDTEVSVSAGVATAVITMPWPRDANWEESGALAARIRNVSNSYLSGSTPVAQTFAEYEMDAANKQLIVRVSTAPSTDIWFRTDGSNQMNADANFGGNNLYGVAGIYTDESGANPGGVELEIGSAINARGVITVESPGGGGDTYLALMESNASGYSLEAEGAIRSNGADFFSRVTVGDGATTASTEIEFLDNAEGSASNVTISGDSGDLVVTNDNGDATVVSDRIYIEAINRFAVQALFNLDTVTINGSELITVPKPSCPFDTTPQLFTFLDGVKQDPGVPILSWEITEADSGGNWSVGFDALNQFGELVVEVFANIVIATKCS